MNGKMGSMSVLCVILSINPCRVERVGGGVVKISNEPRTLDIENQTYILPKKVLELILSISKERDLYKSIIIREGFDYLLDEEIVRYPVP